jgi:hypothetical protein
MHGVVEFGSGLRAKLARAAPPANAEGGDHRLFASVDLRPFYELLTRETLVFGDFAPTAPRPRGKWSQRLL